MMTEIKVHAAVHGGHPSDKCPADVERNLGLAKAILRSFGHDAAEVFQRHGVENPWVRFSAPDHNGVFGGQVPPDKPEALTQAIDELWEHKQWGTVVLGIRQEHLDTPEKIEAFRQESHPESTHPHIDPETELKDLTMLLDYLRLKVAEAESSG